MKRSIDKAIQVVEDCCNLVSSGERYSNRNVASECWTSLAEGWYKLNCDAAVFKDGVFGFGGIIRDWVRDVIASFSEVYQGDLQVDEAKASAAVSGLEIAWEVGVRNVILEVDCIKVANVVRLRTFDRTPFGYMIHDLVNLAKNLRSFSCNHVKRGANVVAHRLAKNSSLCKELRIWMEEVPMDVTNLVLAEKLV